MSTAEKRRKQIIKLLEKAERPIKGYELSEKFGVSRQIIVKDISILKTKNHKIHSSSKGYYIKSQIEGRAYKRVIMCCHDESQIEKELFTIVDNGAMIDDVSVEHPIYGTIKGDIMIETKEQVSEFVEDMKKYQGSMLATLTDSIHLHTISADSEKILDNAVRDLVKLGFIYDSDDL